jgi:hypothetical protein
VFDRKVRANRPVGTGDLRRVLVRTMIFIACLIALAAAVGLPFGLHEFGGLDWSRLSDIGQSYGILAALLAAPSLGLVAFSVLMQTRQARAMQEHNARLLHLELVRLVIDDPRLQMSRIKSRRETRRQQHANLWMMLWRTLYRVGSMNENELRLTVRQELFGQHTDKAFGCRFWERTREAYRASANSRRERRFHDIVDDEYTKAAQA